MQIEDIAQKLPVKGSNGKRSLKVIRYAVLHHDAVSALQPYNSLTRYRVEAEYHIKKGWNCISYHLKINRNGEIYQTLPFEEIGYHAGNWHVNKYGIGICLDGDFSKHDPSFEQEKMLEELMIHLAMERPDMPYLVRKSFYGHKEVRFWPTFCPGSKVVDLIRKYRQL